jgi:predicted nucleic acid-binding protein
MKDRVFLDTNVILDLLGERKPYYGTAARIATLADRGNIILIVSASSYPIVYYILSKFEDSDIVKEKIRKLKVVVETADLTDKIISIGLLSDFPDFEDAIQYYCAIEKECNVLVTRNEKDFKTADIPVMTPNEYLQSIL